jgi:hypothetical protein
MVQFKGTKGKWVINDAGNFETEIVSETHRIAQAKHFHIQIDPKLFEPTPEEGLANAILISKAPDMFDFINRIAGEMLRNDFVLDERWYEQAKQLLTEATKID